MSRKVFSAGKARVTVDTDEMMRILDRATDGAAERFVARAEAALRPVMLDAQAQWPVKTGASRAGFRLKRTLTKGLLRVSIVNDVKHVYYVRWSVRTKADLDAEARRVGSKGHTGADQRAIEVYWRRRLTATHGEGAPTPALAGKRLWDLYVVRPGKVAALKVVGELQADINRLRGR